MEEDRLKAVEALADAMRSVGVSAEEAATAIRHFAATIPPYSEEDIYLIQMNPTLTRFEKFRIIRNMRRQMKGKGQHGRV